MYCKWLRAHLGKIQRVTAYWSAWCFGNWLWHLLRKASLLTRRKNSLKGAQKAKKLLQFPGQCMDFSAISPYLVQPGLTSLMCDVLPSGMPIPQFPACFSGVLKGVPVFQGNLCAAVCRGCKAECRAWCPWILHSHVMPLNMRVFQIKISCYKRFPDPDSGEMEGAWLHTLHHPNTAAYWAAFHVTSTLDLKALAKSSSIFNWV